MVATEATARVPRARESSYAVQLVLGQAKPAREASRQLEVVGHHHQNGALVSMQLEQKGSDGLGGRTIKIAGGLIAQQKFRLANQRPGQSHALPLAAG